MIYVRLHGRMGNQLFEYAAARGLADRLGTEVAVDERMLARMGDRPARPHFNWSISTPAKLPPFRYKQPFGYLLWRYLRRSPVIRRESGTHADFLNWSDESYLHGYWQNEAYFRHIAPALRQECRVLTPPSSENQDIGHRIKETLSVSLHVRRGDFLSAAPDALCSAKYYEAAVSRLMSQIDGDPTIFIFSDDPDWARTNLALAAETVIVDINGPDADYEDLRLMTLCKHNIISNSTFSWWGAWLGDAQGKIVIGPKEANGSGPGDNPWLAQGWHGVQNKK